MRVEKTMVEKINFISHDGKTFESEEECLKHELETKMKEMRTDVIINGDIKVFKIADEEEFNIFREYLENTLNMREKNSSYHKDSGDFYFYEVYDTFFRIHSVKYWLKVREDSLRKELNRIEEIKLELR